MTIYPYLRTKRLAIPLREPTLGEAIAVCKLPPHRHELITTQFLRLVCDKAERPRPEYVTNPRLWTVQERALLVCHYLTHVAPDGPDFTVAPGAHLSAYATFDADLAVTSVDLGLIQDQAYTLRPLLGVHVEVLELECKNRGDWYLGAMACQVRPTEEGEPDWLSMSDIQLLEWVRARIAATRALPESAFEALVGRYGAGLRELQHFFNLGLGDDGIMFEPNDKEAGLGPARFRTLSCLGSATKNLFG